MIEDTSYSVLSHSEADNYNCSTVEEFMNLQSQQSSSLKNFIDGVLGKSKEINSTIQNNQETQKASADEESSSKPSELFEPKVQEINEKERVTIESKSFFNFEYYTDKYEYKGVVNDINRTARTFAATFFDITKKEEMVSTFSFDDLSYEDDEMQIDIGTMFVLVVGKKRQSFISNGRVTNSGKENFCRIYLIRPRALNPREERIIDEDIKRWTKLFNK